MQRTSGLIELGSQVTILLNEINDNLPDRLVQKVKTDPLGLIVDYKMTDAGGVGFVVQFKDGTKCWFFENELKQIKTSNSSSSEKQVIFNTFNSDKSYIVNGNHKKAYWNKKKSKDFKYLLNPLNFINWLLYSMSDVV